MTTALEVTILGCGSSGGVPRADGAWGACDPSDPRNVRSRCSVMLRRLSDEGAERQTTVIIDAAPEFRLQAAAAGCQRLDALLLTHDHADQCHGIDDIRAFAVRQGGKVDCWMDAATTASVTRRFGYLFQTENHYPAIARSRPAAAHGLVWPIDGPSGPIFVSTFDQDHGGMRSLGYRIGNIAYSSDVVDLSETSLAALTGLDVWIVDALRYTPHPTHAHVDKALAWIARVRPKRAILTNMHIDLDYSTLAAGLPPGVEPAHDGLRFTVEIKGAGLC